MKDLITDYNYLILLLLTDTIVVAKETFLSIFSILFSLTPILMFIIILVTTSQTLTTPITTSMTKKWGRLKKNLIIINMSVTPITLTALIFW